MVASELLRAIELQLKQGEAGLDGFVTVVATPTQIVRPGTDAVTTVMYGLLVARGVVGGVLTRTLCRFPRAYMASLQALALHKYGGDGSNGLKVSSKDSEHVYSERYGAGM